MGSVVEICRKYGSTLEICRAILLGYVGIFGGNMGLFGG